MKQRVAHWDNIRLVLITLVVIGHFIDPYTPKSGLFRSIYMFMYAFHMPLFLFISGHFFNSKNITSKCLFYISLGFLLKIVIYLTTVLTGTKTSFSLLADGGIPWYLFVLAWYTIITHLLRNQNKIYILVLSTILACFAGYDRTIGDQLYLSRSIIFFPFFYAGSMINYNTIARLKSNLWIIIGSIAVLLLWAALCILNINDIYILRHLLTGRNPFDSSIVSIGPLMRLLAYFISSITSFSVIILIPGRKIPIISKMGTHSIDVYFWHWPVFIISNYCFHFTDLIGQGRLAMLLYLILPVILTLFLSTGGVISYPLHKIKSLCSTSKE